MSREWKPGDVGITGTLTSSEKAMMFVVGEREGVQRFYYADGDIASHPPRKDARPLVVIDPEDREQVERLTKAYIDASRGVASGVPHEGWMQTALRSLIEPPTEVYEHHVSVDPHRGTTVVSLCGKVWTPKRPNTVSIGKCPECAEIVAAGWTK